jgi:hypothetical protein
MKRCVLAGLPILAFVVGPALSAESAHNYDGAYTGKRALTKGVASVQARENPLIALSDFARPPLWSWIS